MYCEIKLGLRYNYLFAESTIFLKNGIPSTFATGLKTCLWFAVTYKKQILRLSSADFGLVIKNIPDQISILISFRIQYPRPN